MHIPSPGPHISKQVILVMIHQPDFHFVSRCIKEFEVTTRDADSSTSAEMTRARMDRKNALVKELNSYVAMKKT